VITMKSAREIEIMRRSGKITSSVLAELLRSAAGMTLREVDRMAERGIRERGGIPTFKGYHGFPASICASVNEVVVHGIPGDRVLAEGDILSIDIGTTFEGYVSDSAATVASATSPRRPSG
jgi:methionyl aminopeptidase